MSQRTSTGSAVTVTDVDPDDDVADNGRHNSAGTHNHTGICTHDKFSTGGDVSTPGKVIVNCAYANSAT